MYTVSDKMSAGLDVCNSGILALNQTPRWCLKNKVGCIYVHRFLASIPLRNHCDGGAMVAIPESFYPNLRCEQLCAKL